MSVDLFESPDYFKLDDLLTMEHKLVRDTTRNWVKKEVSPIIEDSCQKAEFPKHLIKGLADIGAFGPYIPSKYGGAGMDQFLMVLLCKNLKEEIVELDLQLLSNHLL